MIILNSFSGCCWSLCACFCYFVLLFYSVLPDYDFFLHISVIFLAFVVVSHAFVVHFGLLWQFSILLCLLWFSFDFFVVLNLFVVIFWLVEINSSCFT